MTHSPTAAIISYRLGGTDGVSVEAAKWSWALGKLGFNIRRIAGSIEHAGRESADNIVGNDIIIPSLRHDVSGSPPLDTELDDALGGVDLVIAENICSLPLVPQVARAVADSLNRYAGRVVFHHHDLPSERPETADLAHEFPPRIQGALHVVLSDLARTELGRHGIESTVMRNRFDPDPAPGDRTRMRAMHSFSQVDLVVFHPARGIARKNIEGALQFCEALSQIVGATRKVKYWLSGPAEDGYAIELERLISSAQVPVVLDLPLSVADGYAAGDLVVFPSTLEGFGNPVIESACARRPLAVGAYPVLGEILNFGFEFLSVESPYDAAEFLAPRESENAKKVIDLNHDLARRHFNIADLPAELGSAFSLHGWTSW